MKQPVKIVWTRDSLNDVDNIHKFLCIYSSEDTADNVSEQIINKIDFLSDNPEIGVVKAGYKGRCFILKNLSYSIYYDFDQVTQRITLLRILHNKQKNPLL